MGDVASFKGRENPDGFRRLFFYLDFFLLPSFLEDEMLLSLPALHLQTSEHHPLLQLPHGRYRPERESVWVGGKKWVGV